MQAADEAVAAAAATAATEGEERGAPESKSGAGGGASGGGEILVQAAGAEEKETAAAGAAGNGKGSQPRKTLPVMDPGEALRACAESVGVSVDEMWKDVKRGDGGEIVEIDWRHKDLKGTLPVGDMHMPYLRKLYLQGNRELKGEARGAGVTVVKFTDCFCE